MQKKNSQNHHLQRLPGETKTAETTASEQQNQKTTNNPKWGLWGLLYLLLIGNLIFVVKKSE